MLLDTCHNTQNPEINLVFDTSTCAKLVGRGTTLRSAGTGIYSEVA